MKTREELTADIKKIIRDQMGLDIEPNELSDETDIEKDLSADSLDAVEIIMSIEEMFNIDISDEEIGGKHTIKELVDLTEQKIAAETKAED